MVIKMNQIWKFCIKEATKSLITDDVPVGAILVDNNGKIVAKGHNTKEKENSVLGHAEINCIKKFNKKYKSWNLSGYTMYITLEPCSMCMEFIKQSRISNVYFLLKKPEYKREFFKTKILKYDSLYEQMYRLILSDFFKKKR